MYRIMDGKALRDKTLKELSLKADVLNSMLDYRRVKLVVVSVGDNAANKVYIKNKKKACETAHIDFEEIHINTKNYDNKKELIDDIKDTVNKLNKDDSVDGIILQSPMEGPSSTDVYLTIDRHDETELFDLINPNKDVDAFGSTHVNNLYNGNNVIMSCTPQGIMQLLDEYSIDISGKHAVVIGRSNIVGKPLALALLNKGATVTICHSKTKDLFSIVRTADILISAVGKINLVRAEMIKDDITAIIDVGMNTNDKGKLCGDVDYQGILDRWDFQDEEINDSMIHYITPVPGGVGPMTVANLIANTILLAQLRYSATGYKSYKVSSQHILNAYKSNIKLLETHLYPGHIFDTVVVKILDNNKNRFKTKTLSLETFNVNSEEEFSSIVDHLINNYAKSKTQALRDTNRVDSIQREYEEKRKKYDN